MRRSSFGVKVRELRLYGSKSETEDIVVSAGAGDQKQTAGALRAGPADAAKAADDVKAHLKRHELDMKGIVAGRAKLKTKTRASDPNAFVLQGLLTASECSYYIHETERMTYQKRALPSAKVGTRAPVPNNALYIMIQSREWAAELWRRIEPALKPQDSAGMRPLSLGNQGRWVPKGVSESISFMKIPVQPPADAKDDVEWDILDVDSEELNSVGDTNLQAVYSVLLVLNPPAKSKLTLSSMGFTRASMAQIPTSGANNNSQSPQLHACVIPPQSLAAGSAIFHTHDTTLARPTVSFPVRPPSASSGLNVYVARLHLLFERVSTATDELVGDSYASDNVRAFSNVDAADQWAAQNTGILNQMLDQGTTNWQHMENHLLSLASRPESGVELEAGDVSPPEDHPHETDDPDGDDDGDDGDDDAEHPTESGAGARSPVAMTGQSAGARMVKPTAVAASGKGKPGSSLAALSEHESEDAPLPRIYTAADIGPDSFAFDNLGAFSSKGKK